DLRAATRSIAEPPSAGRTGIILQGGVGSPMPNLSDRPRRAVRPFLPASPGCQLSPGWLGRLGGVYPAPWADRILLRLLALALAPSVPPEPVRGWFRRPYF